MAADDYRLLALIIFMLLIPGLTEAGISKAEQLVEEFGKETEPSTTEQPTHEHQRKIKFTFIRD